MSEYKFSCPHCGQHISHDETCFGQSIHCPACQQIIVVPSIAAAPAAAAPRLSVRLPAKTPQTEPGPAEAMLAQSQSQPTGPMSSLAVASFVLSLLSLILGPFGFIPGIICGHLAKGRLRRDTWLRGLGFAKAGLIIGYLGLTLTIAFVGFTVLGMRKALRASAVEITAPAASGAGEAAGAVPAVVGPTPVSVKVQNFRPKAASKKGGFTILIENRARKPVTRLLLREEYRDTDGVLEKDVPNTIHETFQPNGTIQKENSDFFMLPTTRSVTVSVREVSFADGSEWSQLKSALAAAAPGPLSFAGQAAPASAEVIRFRPNSAKNGNIASRIVNHSNKAIQAFDLEMVCLDATGKKVDTIRAGWSFGSPDLVIGPGGVFEFSKEAPSLNAGARSATFVVRGLTFAGGEKWAPTKK